MARSLSTMRCTILHLGPTERIARRPAGTRAPGWERPTGKRCSLCSNSSRDLVENPLAGSARISGASHLASDHEVVGTCADGFGRRGGTFLIAFGRTLGTDAGNDQRQPRPGDLPDASNFERRANDAVHVAFDGLPDAKLDQLSERPRMAQIGQVVLTKACQNGDGEQLRRGAA